MLKRRDDPHFLVVGMTGVKLGDHIAQVGCADGPRMAAVAAKVGLSGRAVAVVPDEASAERARKGAERAGVLVDIETAPPTKLPLGESAFDLVIIDDTGGLLSALSVHEIGTQVPREVWLAIPHKARAPRVRVAKVRLLRFSGAAWTYGVEDTEFEGVPARITSPARTVVDCFRFQSLIGREAAHEALRDPPNEYCEEPGQTCSARSRGHGLRSLQLRPVLASTQCQTCVKLARIQFQMIRSSCASLARSQQRRESGRTISPGSGFGRRIRS